MGIRDALSLLTATPEQLHEGRLRRLCEQHDTTPIAELEPRRTATVVGEIQSVRMSPPKAPPMLEVTVSDGHGRLVVMFLGRREIGGIVPGRRLTLEGLVVRDGQRTVMRNPAYQLLP